ncbi:MAG: hypothetical protein P8Y93_11770, partial [Acidobacteriota bacterium]
MKSRPIIRSLTMWVAIAVAFGSSAARGESSPPSVEGADSVKSGDAVKSARPEERFEFTSYVEVGELFKKLDYTPEAWQAGIREVPRVYLTTIAPRWRDRVSKEVSVLEKKRIFFRALAPLVLRSNEFILRDRARASELRKRLDGGGDVSAEDRQWLTELAVSYGVVKDG